MNAAIWRSLLWKEWREHRWKLAALMTIAVGTPVLAAVSAGDDHPIGAVITALMLCTFLVLPLGGIFVAMGLAASERSARTLPFLQGMPLSMPRLASVKLVIGVATAWLPHLIVVGFGILLILIDQNLTWYDEDPFFEPLLPFTLWGPFFDAPLAALLTTISLLLWTAAPAVNSASEVRAGATGLVVIAGVWTLVVVATTAMGPFFHGSATDHRYLVAALPGGLMTLIEPSASRRLPFIAIAGPYLLTHLPLAWWYIARFGQISLNADRIQRTSADGWLGAPLRSRFRALAWKQYRECLPVVAAGAACAVALPTFMFLSDMLTSRNDVFEQSSWYGGALIAMFGFFGALAGLVAGIGSSVTELEPKLATFWRSRPINIDQWFWTAFAAGLVILSLAYITPVAVTTFLIGQQGWRPSLVAISAAPAAYAAGWLAGSVLRHAVYASLICIGLLILTMWAGDAVHNYFFKGSHVGEPLAVALLISAIVMSVAAWVCVRNDWSLRLS